VLVRVGRGVWVSVSVGKTVAEGGSGIAPPLQLARNTDTNKRVISAKR